MNKLAVAIIMIISGLILSGCVDKMDKDNETMNAIVNVTKGNDISSNNTNTTNDVNASTNNTESDIVGGVSNEDLGTNGDTTTSSGWCDPGNEITVHDEIFTIKGITTYQGREVCQAEQIYENGKKVRYFSQDGKFVAEIATSSGKNAVATSQSSVTNK